MEYKIKNIGDQAISIYFENKIDISINQSVHYIMDHLKAMSLVGIKGYVPAYQSLMIYYDPYILKEIILKDILTNLADNLGPLTTDNKLGYRIPVLYEGSELAYVADYHGMPINEVIERHTKPNYYIYFLGFAPGFPYLGGLDPKIATPRLEQPKIKIEEGSVGIADHQTGIYTISCPGGWQVIGKTPLKLFRENSCALEAGKYIQFYAIDQKTYDMLKDNDDGAIRLEVLK